VGSSDAPGASHCRKLTPSRCNKLIPMNLTKRENSRARRTALRTLLAVAASTLFQPAQLRAMQRQLTLRFPRDYGAHPDTATEWWYITGWLRDSDGRAIGMQITFFRSRPRVQDDNPSAFAPKQLVLAHAALSDPQAGRLQHDQRAARAGFGLAYATEHNTSVAIQDWSLRRAGERYHGRIAARTFHLALDFEPTQPVLLQGQAGFSRKGPGPGEASFYYSLPHLAVSGTVESAGQQRSVTGQAWLDHEWSDNYLAKSAAGWDWIGINLDDGSALMAFRIRAKRGGEYWAGATHRSVSGEVRTFAPLAVRFQPLRQWRSPRTGVEYPVAMRVRVGDLTLELQPLMDDQELDSRASTGAIYWEGAVAASSAGRSVGRGYLELTGYAAPLQL
jgi:predicted secreted hydrolase